MHITSVAQLSEFLHLNFDAYERLSAIAEAVEKAGLAADAWLLDVGGHPGLLAQMLSPRKVVTVDFPTTGPALYARASGTALPFGEATFAAVLCSDTLEHVPPAAREGFLLELLRVSSRFVFLGAPFCTPGVTLAEARVSELEQRTHASANVWLEEHARCTLPELPATWQTLERAGARLVALPHGELNRWFTLFAAQTLFDALPGAGEALQAFMPDYNSHFSGTPPLGSAAYRHLLLIDAKGESFPEQLTASPCYSSLAQLPEKDPSAEDRIEALFKLFASLGEALKVQAQRAEQGGSLENAYLDQMEKALRQQEHRLHELETQAGSGGFVARATRKLRRLLG